jgi:hypothetical protein
MGSPCRDDLPVVSICPLRATDVVTPSSTRVVIWLDDRRFEVGVAHMLFPRTGGDWAYFIAPCCGARRRKLWLLDGSPHCRACCRRKNYRSRQHNARTYERATYQIPLLQARLCGAGIRSNPRPGRTIDRRNQFENTLLMHVHTLRRHRAEMES